MFSAFRRTLCVSKKDPCLPRMERWDVTAVEDNCGASRVIDRTEWINQGGWTSGNGVDRAMLCLAIILCP